MPQVQIPRPKPYIHQGPTVQPTFPVPPVTAHAPLQLLRRVLWPTVEPPSTAARVDVHQGPTNQPTFPVPKTEQFERAWWLRLAATLIAGVMPEPPILGVSSATPQTYEFKVATNYPPWTPRLRDPNLVNCTDGPTAQFDGPTIQPWFLYPANAPQLAYWILRAAAKLADAGVRQPIDGPTNQQTYIFPVSEPEWAWWLRLRATKIADVGTTLPHGIITTAPQQTYEFKGTTTNPFRVYDPNLAAATVGATRQLDNTPGDWFVYPPNQPERIRFALLELARRFGGPVPQVHQGATVLATDPIPPALQRHDLWFGPLAAVAVDARRMVGPRAQFEGATIQATVPIPGVLQRPDRWFGPLATMFREGQAFSGPRPQFDGATKQQTYIFPPNQPDIRWFLWDGRRFLVVSQAGTWPLIFFTFKTMTAREAAAFLPTALAFFDARPMAAEPYEHRGQSDDPFQEP